eukprot:scaffold2765_cov328-Prasinococcus_capsulatus_cf.AAC.4
MRTKMWRTRRAMYARMLWSHVHALLTNVLLGLQVGALCAQLLQSVVTGITSPRLAANHSLANPYAALVL